MHGEIGNVKNGHKWQLGLYRAVMTAVIMMVIRVTILKLMMNDIVTY